jgi:hypothetical protein
LSGLPLANAHLRTAVEVWEFLVKEGGIDVKNYDANLLEELRASLGSLLSPSGLPPGPFEQSLAASRVSVEQFLVTFFNVAKPYAEMMSELLATFERAGAKSTRRNLRIQFRFSEDQMPLKFDLSHFREWVSQWQEIATTWTVKIWTVEQLWKLSEILRMMRGTPVIAAGAREWLDVYFEARKWASEIPGAPRTGHARLDSALNQAWEVWSAVVRASMAYGAERHKLREHSASDSPSRSEVFANPRWPTELLRLLDSDNWAGLLANGLFHRAEALQDRMDPEARQMADSLSASLGQLFEEIPQANTHGTALKEKLDQFLKLPIWRQRHELYAAWVFTRILDAIEPALPRVHLVGEELSFSFSGSHLATTAVFEPALHVYAELRSPIVNPRGKSRLRNIQPDYTLLTDPLTDVRTSIVAVECKQYLKADSARFAAALEDYAKGQPNARIILVNYGPVNSHIQAKVDPTLHHRTSILGQMRPGDAGKRSRNQFRDLIQDEVRKRFGALDGRQKEISLCEAKKTCTAKIVLSWGRFPTDLDLYLRISCGSEFSVSYADHGSIVEMPFVHLDQDQRAGDGTETIEFARLLDGAIYRCAVHNYSREVGLRGSSARLCFSSSSRSVEFTCPESGEGRWWLIFDWQPDTDRLIIFDKLTESPW